MGGLFSNLCGECFHPSIFFAQLSIVFSTFVVTGVVHHNHIYENLGVFSESINVFSVQEEAGEWI